MRRHNLGMLPRHVHRSTGPISRADLTTVMGLNRSTIAGLVAELEELGIAHGEPATSRKGAGRPSAGVGLSDDGPYVIAVDLGVDRLVVARVGLGGVDPPAQLRAAGRGGAGARGSPPKSRP